jgi:hypothetical protein
MATACRNAPSRDRRYHDRNSTEAGPEAARAELARLDALIDTARAKRHLCPGTA